MNRPLFALVLAPVIASPCRPGAESTDYGPWTAERSREWYNEQFWLVGCNFIPSAAVNQLEMWQAKVFKRFTAMHAP
jgi:hypothetical protein